MTHSHGKETLGKRNHFHGKDPLTHVLEKKEEIHGSEVPGSLSHFFEASKEVSVLLAIIAFASSSISSPFMVLFASACGLIAWKTGRTAWLGWFHLERFHRVIEQEKYEIEHHRGQEREELVALYGSKGFEGKLLDDVVDTLMADPGRLLKVMLEEEMGLTLAAYEHPLKQAFGAFLGSVIASIVVVLLFYFFSLKGAFSGCALILILSSSLYAKYEKNEVIPACVWNIAIGALTFGIIYFLMT